MEVALVFKSPLILVMPILGLCIELDQLSKMKQHHKSHQWQNRSHLFSSLKVICIVVLHFGAFVVFMKLLKDITAHDILFKIMSLPWVFLSRLRYLEEEGSHQLWWIAMMECTRYTVALTCTVFGACSCHKQIVRCEVVVSSFNARWKLALFGRLMLEN